MVGSIRPLNFDITAGQLPVPGGEPSLVDENDTPEKPPFGF